MLPGWITEQSKVWRIVQHTRLISSEPPTFARTETSSERVGGREDINKRGQNGPGLSGWQNPEGAGLESRGRARSREGGKGAMY